MNIYKASKDQELLFYLPQISIKNNMKNIIEIIPTFLIPWCLYLGVCTLRTPKNILNLTEQKNTAK